MQDEAGAAFKWRCTIHFNFNLLCQNINCCMTEAMVAGSYETAVDGTNMSFE